jgi:hypothetical protein
MKIYRGGMMMFMYVVVVVVVVALCGLTVDSFIRGNQAQKFCDGYKY